MVSGFVLMKVKPDCSTCSAKSAFSAKEAVARVDSVRAGYFGGGNDGGNVQITLRRSGRTDAHGFVGEFDVQAAFVGFGMHGNGGNAHFAAGTEYAQGDFAPVGD